MSKSFPWLEILAIGGAGAAIYWFWFHRGGDDGGQSLWPALGFSYGPLGNLPAVGSFNRTGNVNGAGLNGGALPLIISPTNVLTDELGNWLTDQANNPLTDQGGLVGPIFPARNGNGLRFSGVPSGSRPS